MKDLSLRTGYRNRHLDPLPREVAIMVIVLWELGQERHQLCRWEPFDPLRYRTGDRLPARGYLGTARTIGKSTMGIGFHAWEGNDSEFVHYRLVEDTYGPK